ncbi:hypothetical protein DIPPA_11404 [Diplonema papillatum]|nr:hypothetical protein DIPPA_11404 [Diplonema papillatum]
MTAVQHHSWKALNAVSAEHDAFGDTIKPEVFKGLREEPLKSPRESAQSASQLTVAIPHYKVMLSNPNAPADDFGNSPCEMPLSPKDPSARAGGGGRKGTTFIAYVVQCTSAAGSWEVMKRYSEFYKLHTTILKVERGQHLHIPEFPSKIKRFLESERSQIQRRQKKLAAYLQIVWNLQSDGKLPGVSVLLEEFLSETRSDIESATVKHTSQNEGRRFSNRMSILDRLNDKRRLSEGAGASEDTSENYCFIESPRDGASEDRAPSETQITRVDELFSPPMTVVSNDDRHLVVIEVSGVRPDDLHLTILESGVRIFGERRVDVPNTDVLHNDRIFGSFTLDLPIPCQFRPYEKVNANLNFGCLYLSFAKSNRADIDRDAIKYASPPACMAERSHGGLVSPRSGRSSVADGGDTFVIATSAATFQPEPCTVRVGRPSQLKFSSRSASSQRRGSS